MGYKAFKRIMRTFKPLAPRQQARQEFLALRLHEGDIAVDCGANIGKITQILAQQKATVYAFEPNPYAFQVLQEHFKDSPNVHCMQKGVWDCCGVLPLYLHENAYQDQVHWSTGSSFLACKRNVAQDGYIDIEVVDLAEFIQSLRARVKVLKLDVEGAECRILWKLIRDNVLELIDHIFVETHDHKIPELQRDTEELRQYIRDHRLKNINLYWK
jgi:FkbM family methyltransferase